MGCSVLEGEGTAGASASSALSKTQTCIHTSIRFRKIPKTKTTVCSFCHFSCSPPHFPSSLRRQGRFDSFIWNQAQVHKRTVVLLSNQTSGDQVTHQHICGMEVVLACHVGLQPLRHLLDALDFIQQLEDVLVLDPLYPQLPQLVPFAVQQHLTWQEVLLHLQKGARQNSCTTGGVYKTFCV